jgi:hypothetical protein
MAPTPAAFPNLSAANPDHRCDHCGGHLAIVNRWDWPGRPHGIWLHPRSEGPWSDSEGAAAMTSSSISTYRRHHKTGHSAQPRLPRRSHSMKQETNEMTSYQIRRPHQ